MSDDESLEVGDLGLGKGLKPGGLSSVDLPTVATPISSICSNSEKGPIDTAIGHAGIGRCSQMCRPGNQSGADEANEHHTHCNISTDDSDTSQSLAQGSVTKTTQAQPLVQTGEEPLSPISVSANSNTNVNEQKSEKTIKMKLSQVSDKIKLLRKGKSESHGHVNPFRNVTEQQDVQIGTSFSQQKTLFERDAQEVVQKYGFSEKVQAGSNTIHAGNKLQNMQKEDIDNVQTNLLQAHEEVNVLKQQLELCHRQLEGKYQAIEVLQLQANSLQDEQQDNQLKTKQMNKEFQKELSELQFELEYRESSLMYSQQTWAERFDKVRQENSALITTLENRTDEMRKVNAEKIAVARERDELLALLDVQERQQYENSRSSHDSYQSFTSAELAVLGACHCRGRNPEPCTCACAAANMKRDLTKAKNELEQSKKKCQESSVMADAYRIAFEEELARNRTLKKKKVPTATLR